MKDKINKFRDATFQVNNSKVTMDWLDPMYSEMLLSNKTGFYFNKGLHIYGLSESFDYDNLHCINSFLQKEYEILFNNLYAFACDVFGNQFVFKEQKVYYFEIETSEVSLLADNFKMWLEKVVNDCDYYFSPELVHEWQTNNRSLFYEERLTPKIPFILGGEYTISNLYALDFFKAISFSASIAKQVVNLPEGTDFEIIISGK